MRWFELTFLSAKISNLPVLLDLLVYLQALADLADPEKERNCFLNPPLTTVPQNYLYYRFFDKVCFIDNTMVVHGVQVGDVIDDHYASLISPRSTAREISQMVTHPCSYQLHPKVLNFRDDLTGTGASPLVEAVLLCSM